MSYKIVKVTFKTTERETYHVTVGKMYSYKCHILTVKRDDWVVTECMGILKLAQVVGVLDNSFNNAAEANKAKKWIVDVVDLTAYNERKSREDKRKWILKQLHERKKQYEEKQVYKLMAKCDNQSKKLIDELTDLDAQLHPAASELL